MTPSKAIDPQFGTAFATTSLVETFNIPAINKFVLETRPKEVMEILTHRHRKMEQFRKWQKWETELWSKSRITIERFRILFRRKSTIRIKDSQSSTDLNDENYQNSDDYDTKL